MFAGETADFSNSKYCSYNYNQLRLGVQKKVNSTSSGTYEIGTAISLLTAKNGNAVDVRNATLFTEAHGEYLDAVYDFADRDYRFRPAGGP